MANHVKKRPSELAINMNAMMHLKITSSVIVLTFLLFMNDVVKGQDNEIVLECWIRLSAASQNSAFFLSQQKPGTVVDPSMCDEFSRAIKMNIAKLVDKGCLKKRTIKGSFEKLVEEKGNILEGFLPLIAEKYGYYLSKELLGIGLDFRLKTYEPNDEVTLDVTLPPSEMIEFEKYYSKYNFPNK